MNILDAVKKAKKTSKAFYFYYEDGSRTVYDVTPGGLLLDAYGNFHNFTAERLLSKKFTFAEKK